MKLRGSTTINELWIIGFVAFFGAIGCGSDDIPNVGGGGATALLRETGRDPAAVEMGDNAELVQSPSSAKSCIAPSDCNSGFCEDGTCCDSACSGVCQACTAIKKGSGLDGTCGPIGIGLDPDNECPGICSGFGSCDKGPTLKTIGRACSSGAECSSGVCADGVCCNLSCQGTCQACSAALKGSGSDGFCGGIASGSDPNNECIAGVCNGAGLCSGSSSFGNGDACSSAADCGSGFCTDGVCCNSDCSGLCMACHLPGSKGTCSSVAAGQSDPHGAPACLGICDGNGSCADDTGSPCTAGSECASGICNDLVCESPKPANGPLVWMTLRNGMVVAEIRTYVGGSYGPVLDLTEISSELTPGSNIVVNGFVSKNIGYYTYGSSQYVLYGSFSAAGRPNLASGRGPYAPSGDFKRALRRGGTNDTWATNGIQIHQACWPMYCSNATVRSSAGRNDNGQMGGLIRTYYNYSYPWQGYEVGDGVYENIAETLVRYSSGGDIELKSHSYPNPYPAYNNVMALGPAGEFHWAYLANATTLSIVKWNANAMPDWSTTANGAIAKYAFEVDATGNLLFAFTFDGSVDFGAGPMTAFGPKDLGLVKLSPVGTVLWQKHYAGNVVDFRMVRAGSGDIAVLLHRSGTMDLGTGPLTTNTTLAKFDASGTALWHANLDGLGALSLTADLAGSVYVGTSSLTANFGWGTPMSNKPVAIALAKYGTCTGPNGCLRSGVACSANTECASGSCFSGACL